MLKIYSYVIDHDLGLAPNPFGEYCTLAVCKVKIRKSKNLNIGDWIIGTGSVKLEKLTKKKYVGKLIYSMKVEEILSFEEYWEDERFQYKKPVINGSLTSMYGDNIYHKNENGDWIQENSAHSNYDGSVNINHLKKDVSGENVLISKCFFYFGNNALTIPNDLIEVCHFGVGEKIVKEQYTQLFIDWLLKDYEPGIHGEPINWYIYNNQLRLFK